MSIGKLKPKQKMKKRNKRTAIPVIDDARFARKASQRGPEYVPGKLFKGHRI